MPKVPPEVVSETSLQKAQHYLLLGEYGRAFAHFLVVFRLSPTAVNDISLREDFTFALGLWGQQLEKQKKIRELLLIYENALDLFPACDVILINFGAHLFRLGYLEEAAKYFKHAVEQAPHSIVAMDYLDNINNALVERWHFVMLNSFTRNYAFKVAIDRAVSSGHQTVLDIGSGTGILSMISATAGAQHTFGCEVSKTMYDVSLKVLKGNELDHKVLIINRKSTELLIPNDIHERVSLVVTETFDAAVFGENILETLIHAWNFLLLPRSRPGCQNGQVIPLKATLWACLIECKKVRQYSRLMMPDVGGNTEEYFMPGVVMDQGTDDEPYTTERLSEVRHGYKKLSMPQEIMEVDFNNVDQLQMLHNKWSTTIAIPCTNSGTLDAVAVWFDLHLDEITKISTHPESDTCWEQATFPVSSLLKKNMDIKQDTVIQAKFAIHKTLHLINISNFLPEESKPMQFLSRVNLLTNDVLILNDLAYHHALESALMSFQFVEQKSIFMLSSLAAFMIAIKFRNAFDVHYIDSPLNRHALFEIADLKLCKSERAPQDCEQCVRPTLSYLLGDVVESSGILNSDVLLEFALLRESTLQRPFCIIPRVIRCVGVLIESDALAERNSLINNVNTLGFNISDYINIYQVSNHLNLDLLTLPHKELCKPHLLLEMDLATENKDSSSDAPRFLNSHAKIDVGIMTAGKITAIAYWFELLLSEHMILSTLNSDCHWNQAAFVLDKQLSISPGQVISLVTDLVNGKFRIHLEEFSESSS